MRGYKVDEYPYLTGDRNKDRYVLGALSLVYFNFAFAFSVYGLYDHNTAPVWQTKDIRMPGDVARWVIVYLPLCFYLFQNIRMIYMYVTGIEWWKSPNPVFDTFEVCPLFDFFRTCAFVTIGLVGLGFANAIMQHTDLRADALMYGSRTAIVMSILTVLVPLVIILLQRWRRHNLRKLATYRELGGSDSYTDRG
jgi:hypothetical protein